MRLDKHHRKVGEMDQKQPCMQVLLGLYQQMNTLVNTLPEEEIPF